MTTENQARRNHTEAFKREAVALVTEQGYKLSEAARSVGVNANLLGKWRDRFSEEATGTRLTGDERDELLRLRKENRLLKMEKEILKKARMDSRGHCNTILDNQSVRWRQIHAQATTHDITRQSANMEAMARRLLAE